MPSDTGRTKSYGSDHSTYSIEKVADEIIKGAAHQNSEITIDKVHIHVSR